MELRKLVTCAALALLLGSPTGCAEDTACVTDDECPAGQVCSGGFCEAKPPADGAGADGTADGAVTPDTLVDAGGDASGVTDIGGADVPGLDDLGTPIGDVADTGTPPDDTGTTPPDTGKKEDINGEVDLVAPYVVSTTPADGEQGVALPFVVTITFSEAMRKEGIDSNTFKLTDVAGKPVGGDPVLSADGKTVTLTPTPNKLLLTSPYHLRVGRPASDQPIVVADVAGNKLEEELVVVFYTAAPAGMEEYATLAAQLSPTVHQGVSKDNPKLDYPTRFDLDGDFEAVGNPTYISETAKSVDTAIYWDVAETKSHLFFTYVFYYPLRKPAGGGVQHANDTAGLIVVARKDPELTPIEAITYGRDGDVEEMLAYVVEGSEISGKPLVDKEYPTDTLFPDQRFQSYLTTPRHQSCAWIHDGPGSCKLNDGVKKITSFITYAFDQGVATKLEKKDGAWPMDGDPVDYQLVHWLPAFWTHRDEFGSKALWESKFDYEPLFDRPGDFLVDLPRFFGSPDTMNGGRPPWSWNWKPAIAAFYGFNEGTPFLDPAIYVAKRHSLDTNWDSATKTGFSTEYCFHPYQGIDKRGTDPDCP